jgi:NTE family protein
MVAGISIGAINAAIIAGNERQARRALKAFWGHGVLPVSWIPITPGDRARSLFNETSA